MPCTLSSSDSAEPGRLCIVKTLIQTAKARLSKTIFVWKARNGTEGSQTHLTDVKPLKYAWAPVSFSSRFRTDSRQRYPVIIEQYWSLSDQQCHEIRFNDFPMSLTRRKETFALQCQALCTWCQQCDIKAKNGSRNLSQQYVHSKDYSVLDIYKLEEMCNW